MVHKLTYNFEERATTDQAIAWARGNMSGESMGSTCFPPEIHGTPNADKAGYKRLPDLVKVSGFWVVSEATANIMRGFNLGGGGLFPVKVLNRDRDIAVPGAWFCINFGNRKSAFQVSESVPMRQTYVRNGEKAWAPKATLNDGDIAVSKVATAGADIWIDPDVAHSFFLSEALGAALKKAKADKGFFLHKCRVV